MENSVEYLIFIGLNDDQASREIVSEQELIDMVTAFFTRNKIDFTVLRARGGYLYEEGHFITESTLCIDIIGDSQLDIMKLAKNLSMYMNQEHSLVVKSSIKAMFC